MVMHSSCITRQDFILFIRGDNFFDELIALLATAGVVYGGTFGVKLQRDLIKAKAKKAVDAMTTRIDDLMAQQQQTIMSNTTKSVLQATQPFEEAIKVLFQRCVHCFI